MFSNAVFHWIADHERLFRRLHATLRPGGRLAAQCGGEGNVASLGSAIREVWAAPPFTEFEPPPRSTWNFASPEATASRLLAAGFTDVDCWLEPRPVTPPEPRAFLEAVTVGPHLERLPGELRDPFLDAVLERLGEPVVLDYVRLNIAARRPG